jgi:hypothetical protein
MWRAISRSWEKNGGEGGGGGGGCDVPGGHGIVSSAEMLEVGGGGGGLGGGLGVGRLAAGQVRAQVIGPHTCV